MRSAAKIKKIILLVDGYIGILYLGNDLHLVGIACIGIDLLQCFGGYLFFV